MFSSWRSISFVLCAIVVAITALPNCTTVPCNIGDRPLRFALLGDTGGLSIWPYYSKQQRDVAEYLDDFVAKKNITFITLLGDNFYFNGVTSVADPRFMQTFENVYDGLNLQRTPFYIIAGNHDHYGSVQAQIDYTGKSPRWKYPSLYYTTQYQFVNGQTATFVYVDTIVLCGHTTPNQALSAYVNDNDMEDQPEPVRPEDIPAAERHWQWINETLRNQMQSDYLFVIGHYPVYSVADHGSTNCLVQKMKPLLEQYNVNAYIAGHDHDLQHLVTRNNGVVMNYVVSGAAAWMKRSYKHERSVPAGSSRFFYPSSYWDGIPGMAGLGKGGFIYVELGRTGGKVLYLNKEGTLLHSFDLQSRKSATRV